MTDHPPHDPSLNNLITDIAAQHIAITPAVIAACEQELHRNNHSTYYHSPAELHHDTLRDMRL